MHGVELPCLLVRQVEHPGGPDLEPLLLQQGDDLAGLAAAEGVRLDDRERVVACHRSSPFEVRGAMLR
jgi:hypothetical protein